MRVIHCLFHPGHHDCAGLVRSPGSSTDPTFIPQPYLLFSFAGCSSLVVSLALRTQAMKLGRSRTRGDGTPPLSRQWCHKNRFLHRYIPSSLVFNDPCSHVILSGPCVGVSHRLAAKLLAKSTLLGCVTLGQKLRPSPPFFFSSEALPPRAFITQSWPLASLLVELTRSGLK